MAMNDDLPSRGFRIQSPTLRFRRRWLRLFRKASARHGYSPAPVVIHV